MQQNWTRWSLWRSCPQSVLLNVATKSASWGLEWHWIRLDTASMMHQCNRFRQSPCSSHVIKTVSSSTLGIRLWSGIYKSLSGDSLLIVTCQKNDEKYMSPSQQHWPKKRFMLIHVFILKALLEEMVWNNTVVFWEAVQTRGSFKMIPKYRCFHTLNVI